MKTFANILASTLIGLLAIAISVVAVADDSKCTPFGDPPAGVNHGYYASFVTSHNPVCFGGKILGPWNDADGTPRYSCLYEPATASKEDPGRGTMRTGRRATRVCTNRQLRARRIHCRW